jgi:hypothetical protein
VKTGDPKLDHDLAMVDSGDIRLSDRVANGTENGPGVTELREIVDMLPDGNPQREEALGQLKTLMARVMLDHTALADSFIEDERNERFPVEDSQGNLVMRETDAKGHTRETITATRAELAEKKARQRWANEELAASEELFGQADEFTKATAGMGDAQAEALKARADELRTVARTKKQALRDAGVKVPFAADELMRRREAATEEVANVLKLSRKGQLGEALHSARALDRERIHELWAAADDRDRELLNVLKHESSVDMTTRAMQGGQIIREGMGGGGR